jgi:hypothetical protein
MRHTHPVQSVVAVEVGHEARSNKQLQQAAAMAILVEATPDYKDQCLPQPVAAAANAQAATAQMPRRDPPVEPFVNVFRVVDSDEDEDVEA